MKIPVVALIYKERDIVWKFIDAIVKYSDILDIYLVENFSELSDYIPHKHKIYDLMERGLIKKHIVFEENISNNAVETVLKDGLIDLNSEYVIVTDGDLVPDKGWLKEHIDILRNNQDVFVVGNSLKMDNLPLKTFPNALTWIPGDYMDCGDYLWTRGTGTHLMTFRTFEFKQFLTKLGTGFKFCDTNIHIFAEHLNKKSARTKQTKSIHMTWDLYKDLNHPYTKEKMANPNIFNHNEYCNYEVFSK